MLVSAIVNTVVSRRLFKVGRETDSVALQADGWHLRTDVYTSLGVMFGLLVIWVGGRIWPGANLGWIDPVVAIVVALMIMKAAYDLTREAARDLLDVSLPGRGRRLDPGLREGALAGGAQLPPSADAQGRAPPGSSTSTWPWTTSMSVGEAHELGDEIVVAIKERLPDSRVHIHVEPCAYQCPESCESGCSVPVEARHAGEEATMSGSRATTRARGAR